MTTKIFKRKSGRKPEEMRPISAKVGIIPNADGSAMYQSGETIAIAAVYGPKKMHPQHMQDPGKGVLRCTYSMLSFSVTDRIRPGPNRRSTEISKIIEWAIEPVLMIDKFPNTVIDVHINIIQADAGTRCAAINAAAMALASAGIPMKNMVSSIAAGKLDKTVVLDLDKYEDSEFEEGEGSTDIPMTFTDDGKLTHIQIDGNITKEQLKEAIEMAKKASKKIYEVQKKALKDTGEEK
ncbi:MAG: exosome complex exonuclease Rrp41 [Nanoarchaeota archaeon]|nr:exosome complex exonuclease Rrp41 [Nanoarchaeota archaeon]MBU1027415.1 exosome complex exonuclease Rrp41 [Nanoarchaeota archaeon]